MSTSQPAFTADASASSDGGLPEALPNRDLPNWFTMYTSACRTLRTGSTRAASRHWYTTTKRVIPPSTGSSNTMSAVSSPTWGRASGAFSTLMARACRVGSAPAGGGDWPVSGQVGGGGGGVGDALGEADADAAALADFAAFFWPHAVVTNATAAAMQATCSSRRRASTRVMPQPPPLPLEGPTEGPGEYPRRRMVPAKAAAAYRAHRDLSKPSPLLGHAAWPPPRATTNPKGP